MRTTTWESIGTNVSNCHSVEEVLHASGLDYEVYKEPIYTESGLLIPNTVATMANIDGTPTNLGVVSDKYKICQNRDAFDFVDNISDELQFVKAGQTKSGMIYIIGVLPSLFVLGDEIKPYVILQNGHNGLYSLRSTICPLRIVCQNQFSKAFGNSDNNISIQHSSNMEVRMETANIFLSNVAEYMRAFGDEAEKLASTRLSIRAEDIISRYFDMTKKEDMSDRVIATLDNKKEMLISAYHADDNQNFQGTVWGVANAFADYITHRDVKNTKNAEENKFVSVTFNPVEFNKFMNFVSVVA